MIRLRNFFLYPGGNAFTGTIPSEIGLNWDLRTLILGKYSIEAAFVQNSPSPLTMTLLSIPSFLRAADNNYLTGNIPIELAELGSLAELSLCKYFDHNI